MPNLLCSKAPSMVFSKTWVLLICAVVGWGAWSNPSVASAGVSPWVVEGELGSQDKDGESKEEHGKDEHGAGHADLTHAFANPELESATEFRTDIALFTAIVFVLLCFVLYGAAWKGIKQGLQQREASIAGQIEDARRASEEAKAKLVEYQAKLDAAAVQAQEMVAQARKDAEAAGQRILADAQAEATRQKDRALADIESAKVAALSELGAKSTDIAFSLARGIVGRELKPGDHQKLIQDSLSHLANRN